MSTHIIVGRSNVVKSETDDSTGLSFNDSVMTTARRAGGAA